MSMENARKVLTVALRMQGSSEGLTLEDIQEIQNCSRSTAERLRNIIVELFGQAVGTRGEDNRIRWRIPPDRGIAAIPINADELVLLNTLVLRARQDGFTDQAEALQGAISKLLALATPKTLATVEADLDALIHAEGLASRPGPHQTIDPGILGDLRQAIKGCNVVNLTYHSLGNDAVSFGLSVHPYGFLYGHRHYLVAYNPYAHSQGYHLFALSRIEAVDIQPENFLRNPTFDIHQFARRSFGTFQEDPYDVVWRVQKERVAEAKTYQFHPDQVFEDREDGSLIIRFTAGGLREMCWHLFTWNGAIEIIEPPELVDEMREQLRLAKQSLPRRPKP